jgi:hypothetical protein
LTLQNKANAIASGDISTVREIAKTNHAVALAMSSPVQQSSARRGKRAEVAITTLYFITAVS